MSLYAWSYIIFSYLNILINVLSKNSHCRSYLICKHQHKNSSKTIIELCWIWTLETFQIAYKNKINETVYEEKLISFPKKMKRPRTWMIKLQKERRGHKGICVASVLSAGLVMMKRESSSMAVWSTVFFFSISYLFLFMIVSLS